MSDEVDELDELLRRSSSALREETSAPNPRSGLTRARLLDSAEKRYASRRRPWLRWLIPVTGTFVVGTALAQRAPDYWPALRAVLRPVLELPEVKPKPARKPRPARPTPAPVAPSPVPAADAGLPTTAEPEPSAVEPPSGVAPSSGVEAPSGVAPSPSGVAPSPNGVAPPRARGESLSRGRAVVRERTKPKLAPAAPAEPTPSEPTPASTPAPAARSAELELFRRAQTLHNAHDPGALAAWDAYLRVADQGVLVPEARYNRALCLIRLGRRAEARAALTPFARGDYGNYRRSEANALLDKLK